jgi:hypothetical protein
MKTVLLVLIIIGAGIISTEVFNSYQRRSWDGLSRFTAVKTGRNGEDISVLSVDPETGSGVTVVLPGEMEIPTVNGKGVWKISALSKLGLKYGSKWVADSVADFLGVPYTLVWEEIGFWDRLAWWNVSRGVEFKNISLTDTSWIEENKDPDGEKVLGLSSIGQKKIGEMFFSSRLAKENLNISVYNTTGIGGMGTRFSRVVENAGFKVVNVAASQENIENCEVRSNTNMKQNTGVRWLVRYFECVWSTDSDLGDRDVNIRIGKEYAGWRLGD